MAAAETKTGTVGLERIGGIAILTANRPKQRNAMSAGMVDRLNELLSALGEDESVRAVVLTGAGGGFCAGSDLLGLALMTPQERSDFEAESGRLAILISRLPVPVIAAVQGYAIGGGLTLAAACDVVVTEGRAKWSLPEVPIGLFPAWGLQHVEARIGRPAARRLSWGIETLDGHEAFRIGLVDHVVEDGAFEAAQGIAQRLAALPRAQSASVKAYFSPSDASEQADASANRLFMQATETPEALACFSRFAAKSKL
jgi:enoyl-CoA hydratase/carnithine racemase